MVDMTLGISLPIIGCVIAVVGLLQKNNTILAVGCGIVGYSYLTGTTIIT